jgi:PAS domain S-box-containing protein
MLPDARVRQRDYLLETSRALTGELNLSKLLTMILNIAIEMLAGHAGFVALHEPARGWSIAVSQSLPDALLRYLENWIARIPADSDPGQVQIPEINRFLQDISMGLLSGVGLPLVAQNEVIGLIYIFRNYPGIFSANDRSLLSSFANQAAIGVRNARLYTETITEKRRMDALLDSSADGMLILTPDHKIERANPAFARLFGTSQMDIQGKGHGEILKWSKPPHGTTLEAAEADGWPLSAQAQLYVEGDLIRPGGKQPLPIGITYAPLFSYEGALINIIATVRDITRFRQADELKSIFISEVSHELKTPVALIKGYVSTLRREDAQWDKSVVKESLAVIEEEADRLTELIENLLDASRLQAGGFELKRSEISLHHAAQRMAERFRIQTDDHKIILNIPEDFPMVLADEGRVEQVFSNMLSNAIKYAPGGEIRIDGSVRTHEVIVCVTDQGPGIAPGDLPYIFERFYRAPDSSRNTKGTGLGLYLSRSIIEAHGGHMWVDPTTEKGARFCFSLPRI